MNDELNFGDPSGTVEIVLSHKQRDLLAGSIAIEPEVRAAIDAAKEAGGGLSVLLPEEEWEALAGDLSVLANHTRDGALQRRLDDLIETIEDALLFDEDEEDDQ